MNYLKFFIAVLLFLGINTFLFSQPMNAQEGIKVGNKAPDMVGQSFDGTTYKLSSLKGKLVLIDFWAAWCYPCRLENPNVVKAYHQFKDKKFKNGDGFTVFGVSLDNDKKKWKEAVEKDALVWEYHISDLKGWQSQYAKTYGVRGIPFNFLIDGNGIILAQNLRGENLSYVLSQFLK